MKRIDIRYGGELYSVGGRDPEELQQQILTGLAGGGCWLTVNDGEGMPRAAQLLITPGVAICLIPIPDPEGDEALTEAASTR